VVREKFSCDNCGRERGETNRWFIAKKLPGKIQITGFTESDARKKNSYALCGESCLHNFVNQNLAELH
jgi:hypothetical protein